MRFQRDTLRLWFKAMLLLTCQHSGISARNLRRQVGLGSYQTAWLWLDKHRRAMVRPSQKRLGGQVEVDETLVGGPEGRMGGRKTLRKAYLDAFVFRYNRRSSRTLTLPFQRLCTIAVLTPPLTYRQLVVE